MKVCDVGADLLHDSRHFSTRDPREFGQTEAVVDRLPVYRVQSDGVGADDDLAFVPEGRKWI